MMNRDGLMGRLAGWPAPMRWLAITLAVLTAPVWLPVYWVGQTFVAFVGVCYYVVIERTLAVVFSRTMNRTRVRVRWFVVPLLILALPFALTIQVLAAVWKFLIWWHRVLGRWQWGGSGWVTLAAGIVFEVVAVIVLVGTFYHPLAWKALHPLKAQAIAAEVAGTELTVDQRISVGLWCEEVFGETIRRYLLSGSLALAAVVLLFVPTVIGRLRWAKAIQPWAFVPRLFVSAWALNASLTAFDVDSGAALERQWLTWAAGIVAACVLAGLMVLGWRTTKGYSSWKQFVWFSAMRLLEKKRIALFSLGAVTLCTAMLLIVVSVMGGFVDNIRNATHGLMGDVIMEGDRVRGFPYYDGFVQALQSDPKMKEIVAAATARVHAVGLLKVWNPERPNYAITNGVQIVGIDIDGMNAVTGFDEGLTRYKDPKERASVTVDRPFSTSSDPKAETLPGLIYGRDVLARRDPDGNYYRDVDPNWPCLVSVIPVSLSGNVMSSTTTVVPKKFQIVDDSKTGVFDIDYQTVYVGFKYLQTMLYMDGESQERSDGSKLPARAHQILIKLRPGVSLEAGRMAIAMAWEKYTMAYADDPLVADVDVESWEEYNRKYIAAVETEKQLMMILFGIISLVTVFMVLCVFYMIVVEKTRDIGVLKSIGASATQVAFIFLAYAGVIGAVGSAIGVTLGHVFVRHINQVHDWLVHVFGWRVWNREVYVFDLIPDSVKQSDVVTIVILATLASVVGAIIPAIRAARMNPVEALRYE